jgi:hypothetical protein
MNLSERIMEAIEGATIVSGRVDDGEGLCLDLSNGKTLVIAGMFAISLQTFADAKLH